jgi:hypothetical protein
MSVSIADADGSRRQLSAHKVVLKAPRDRAAPDDLRRNRDV